MATDKERIARLENEMKDTKKDLGVVQKDVDTIKHQRSWLVGAVAGIVLLGGAFVTLMSSTVIAEVRKSTEMQERVFQAVTGRRP